MTAEEILAEHTRGHFALNSNVYAAKNDIVRSMQEYASQQVEIKEREHQEKIADIREEVSKLKSDHTYMVSDAQKALFDVLEILDKHLDDKK